MLWQAAYQPIALAYRLSTIAFFLPTELRQHRSQVKRHDAVVATLSRNLRCSAIDIPSYRFRFPCKVE